MPITDIVTLPITDWHAPRSAAEQASAIDALEHGSVLLFPKLAFTLPGPEARLLSPAIGGTHKNISLEPATGVLRGGSGSASDLALLQAMMLRFARSARALMDGLFPQYAAALQQARTSFRPDEIEGRVTSWRKDDTRLHVDSFPSSPTRGKRILRVFANVNPQGQQRRWRVGDSFEAAAQHHLPAIAAPLWGSSQLLGLLHITKTRRSAYDHYMLQLHDRMKADAAYQRSVPQRAQEFAPGQAWMVFTDQVSHAAMGGRYALEQTFHVPVASMKHPAQAPLRVLERLLGRALV